MPAYGLPGVATGPRRARRIGIVLLVCVVAVTAGWRVGSPMRTDDTVRIQLHTSSVGDGVIPGAEVLLHGVKVGNVATIASAPEGSQLLTLSLQPSKLRGLTDSLDIDYAPSNLFGISAVVLKRRDGGTPLRTGQVLDLLAAGRITDATLGNLLRELSQTSTDVLTPQLTDLVNQAAGDLKAFTPTLQAVVSVSRAIADTQRYPSSFLTEQYGSFVGGTAKFVDGTIKLIDQVYHIDVLRNDRERFDTGVSLVVDQLFPMISDLGWTLHKYGGNLDSTTTALHQLSLMNPDPDRTREGLSELLKRLDGMFTATPDGPEMNIPVTVALQGVPGLAQPLLGGQIPPPPPPGGGG